MACSGHCATSDGLHRRLLLLRPRRRDRRRDEGHVVLPLVPDLGVVPVPRAARGARCTATTATSCAASARGCGQGRQAPRRGLHPLRHRARLPRGRDRAGIGRQRAGRLGSRLGRPVPGRRRARDASGRRHDGVPEGGGRRRRIRAIRAARTSRPTTRSYDAGIQPHPGPPRGRAAATPPRATPRRPARSASCFATSGPGATNLVTPITDAMMDSVPVVFFTGQVRTDLLGTDGFQEADTFGITMPIVKHSFMIQHPPEIPRVVHEAFHIARTGRPGPVLVDMPHGPHAGGDRLRAGRPTCACPATSRRPRATRSRSASPPRRSPTRAGRSSTPAAASINADAAGRADRARRRRPLPGHLHADGPRRVPGAARAVARACSACTARARPTTRWTRPT